MKTNCFEYIFVWYIFEVYVYMYVLRAMYFTF